MHKWAEAHKLSAGSMDNQKGAVRYGIVTSADVVRMAIKVTYQPSNSPSGWLQLVTPWCGPGWGLVAAPPIGAQVALLPVEGEAEECIVLGVTYNDQDAPPAGYAAGEFWIVHQSGSYLQLNNDGTVQIKGDLHVNGDVYDRHGSLDRLRGHYNAHNHATLSSPPNPTDPE